MKRKTMLIRCSNACCIGGKVYIEGKAKPIMDCQVCDGKGMIRVEIEVER